MSIASDLIRGTTDMMILAHLLEGDSYGYDINKSIRMRTGDRFELKEATLYTAFRRLEQQGYISSYTITSPGRKAFIASVREWENAKALIDSIIQPHSKDSKDE